MAKEAAPNLADVRAKIDAVDRELLRLIDKRAALAGEVAAAKRAAGDGGRFAIRPARENQVLRALLSEERTSASRRLVLALWREIIGDSLNQQTPFQIAVWPHRQPGRVTELARARFGSAPGLYLVDQPEQALSSVKSLGGVAVLAVTREHAWWGRMLVEPTLSIISVLPEIGNWGAPVAMAVAEVKPEPSGAGDDTLWVTDSRMQSYEIEQQMGIDGVAAQYLIEANGLKLFRLSGYYQAEDERLARAPGELTGIVGVVPTSFDT